MIELELLGPSADGQSVVFTDEGGNRFQVVIDDKLRTIVRRNTGTQDPSPVPAQTKLRPSDIQSLLRQGREAREIADTYGLRVESVLRYESPVSAEKAWAVLQAQRAPVGIDPSTPRLEELVINRLATRGVDQTSLQWNAQKHPGKEWEVSVTFIQSAVERVATWQLSADGKQLEAMDQEAHWLTESANPSQSVRALFADMPPLDGRAGSASDSEETDLLIDQLNAQRGKRQPVMDVFDGDDSDVLADAVDSTSSLPYFSARMASVPAHVSSGAEQATDDPIPFPVSAQPTPQADGEDSGGSTQNAATAEADDEELTEPLFETADVPEPKPKKKKRGQRTSVPSWDEIVFGTRAD